MKNQAVPFIKMHALGNDFVMLDAIRYPLQSSRLKSNAIRLLADRHFGVGFDQLLVCEAPQDFNSDFFMRIYNADGNEAEQCGNGARCFYHYVRAIGLTAKKSLKIQTSQRPIALKGVIASSANRKQLSQDPLLKRRNKSYCPTIVRADMGEADFSWDKVFKKNKGMECNQEVGRGEENVAAIRSFNLSIDDLPLKGYLMSSDRKSITAYPVSFGNPHLVIIYPSLSAAEKDLAGLGEVLSKHHSLINGANINFLICNNKSNMELRTYERGAGITLACGSGACASFALARRLGLAAKQVVLKALGGRAVLGDDKGSIYMESAVHITFSGAINLPVK